MAGDAFTNDVSDHVLWERVKCAKRDRMEEVFRLAKEFFAVVHRSHMANNKKHICVQGAWILAESIGKIARQKGIKLLLLILSEQ